MRLQHACSSFVCGGVLVHMYGVVWCTQCTMHVNRCAPACIRVLVNLGRYAFETQLSAYDIHPGLCRDARAALAARDARAHLRAPARGSLAERPWLRHFDRGVAASLGRTPAMAANAGSRRSLTRRRSSWSLAVAALCFCWRNARAQGPTPWSMAVQQGTGGPVQVRRSWLPANAACTTAQG